MASAMGFRVSPFSAIHLCHGNRSRAQAQNLDGGSTTVPSSDSVPVRGASLAVKVRQRMGVSGLELNRGYQTIAFWKIWHRFGNWDDGYGTQIVEDYFNAVKEMNDVDVGPPRWFCPVECGQPVKDSPTLLFLPGLDGTGMGLIRTIKLLGSPLKFVACIFPSKIERHLKVFVI